MTACWEPIGEFKPTSEGLTPSNIQIRMFPSCRTSWVFSIYRVMQEQMRGLTKDFNTKIEPMLKLKEKSNPQATQHL